jgi:hypothetical protein
MEWLGHAATIEDNPTGKTLTQSQCKGSRKKGIPRARWLDSKLKNLKTLKVTAWWRKAQDGGPWRKIIKEARPTRRFTGRGGGEDT